VGAVDAAQALADLTEISAQIRVAVVASPDGTVVAATLPDGAAAALARAGSGLLREAGERAVSVEARTGEASVFAVRDDAHTVAAVASQGAASGLVLYDLRAALRRLAEEPRPELTPEPEPAPEQPKPKRAPAKKKADDAP
jgi:predicted regulator of Ras-like GTPase activity (Roadblock/LC7/MglB family)